MSTFKDFIAKVSDGHALSPEEAREAFEVILSGSATPSQLGGFLMALRVRGESIAEVTGAVATMRSKMIPVRAPANAMDIVGTGGDNSGSYNISTCTALVVAGSGVPVAKHGNRSLSSKSGAAEALAELGVNIDIDARKISDCINRAGIGFMFAPLHHAAMKHVGPTRMELGTRTIFNLLGPLTNPAGVKRQMVGVFARKWVEPLAEALRELGSEKAWVVHGSDGMDEITTTGPTAIAELKNGTIRSFEISPEDVGLAVSDPKDLKGGLPSENAKALRDVLAGAKNAYRDVVLFNAAASLLVADKVETLKDGVELAAQSIDSGSAADTLEKLVAASNG
ncbi:anthranilate phosphoribosyltransferase [Roseibium algicola]|jgi:anthranilate phosphoribosyltransferase|uniref:Anthranilate phosphoribosyltransferase n=1 Tax=Roseibium algicola TaxID=2857014 RepID=A0ABN4X0X3_9HYPH|nr:MULTISPECIES: anthranilate phosphoribosyltransferase [Stappiaceae]MCR9283001.1 anthranilate phosphoribosyltransferase [Paracoccaceae bacterium]MEC9471946.1 anthranilate phosphoribosyltransferase [Pseudomonadota bacterium]AMN53398.1 anthranilate phosphoribosyltransferase [Labrenzia sp. CP4]AQQ06618.1 anthranilate phosphoribosyltransferase [Roseibium aggregatum]ERP97959.1 anthranilate phosphoribosyltransferase [Labrenzia sp. C1B10]